jgi:hypothetical protein
MSIRKILKDIEVNYLVGVMLLSALTVIYFYYNPSTIKDSDTSAIVVVLTSKPDYRKPNSDNYPYISFKGIGYDNEFDISSCALDLINIYDVLRLNIGDSLKLKVETDDLLYEPKKFIYNPITVCGIETFYRGKILDLNDYNECKQRSWKRIGLFAIIFVLFLGMIIVNSFRKNKNNG